MVVVVVVGGVGGLDPWIIDRHKRRAISILPAHSPPNNCPHPHDPPPPLHQPPHHWGSVPTNPRASTSTSTPHHHPNTRLPHACVHNLKAAVILGPKLLHRRAGLQHRVEPQICGRYNRNKGVGLRAGPGLRLKWGRSPPSGVTLSPANRFCLTPAALQPLCTRQPLPLNRSANRQQPPLQPLLKAPRGQGTF